MEKSVYFGVLLYLKEEKRKRRDNRIKYKKIDMLIEFMKKKLLNNTDLIDLIELYEFIGEEIYLEFKNEDRLNWNEYFRPKIKLVRVRFQKVRTKEEIKKLFFELLGKVGNFQRNKYILSKDERLKRYFEREVDEDREKSIKRINKFKENASWLLNDLGKNKDKIDITEENYKEIEYLLIEFKNDTEQKEKEKIRKLGISESKINIFRKELEKILSESRVIKWLKNLGKYKEGIKGEDGKARYIGQYMEKEYFVETGDEGGTKAIAESYGKRQNRAIEQIIIDKLNLVAEESDRIENALKNIKGEPWIILTGISIFNFFYDIKDGSTNENIIIKSDLDKKYFEKYGEILEGMYKYKNSKIPIYNFISDKKGIYILDSDDIKGFIHYDSFEEDERTENMEKRVDNKKVGYSYLTIIEAEKIIESGEIDKILKSGILKDYETEEEKLYQFKQLVWVSFVQKGALKLKENAKVYKVEFNG